MELTTRERIVQAARKLFYQHGVRNVTMDDIATDLGMSKRTIYEHVKNKDDLLEECIIQSGHEREKEIEKLEKESGNEKMIDLIKAFIRIGSDAIKSDIGVLIMEVKRYHPAVFASTIGKNRSKNFNKTKEFIKKGVDEEFFIENTDIEVMALLMSNIFMTFEKNDDLMGFEKRQMPDVFKSIFLCMCRGMATLHGIREIDEAFNIKDEKNNYKTI